MTSISMISPMVDIMPDSHSRAQHKLGVDISVSHMYKSKARGDFSWTNFHCLLCMGIAGFAVFWTLLLLRWALHGQYKNTDIYLHLILPYNLYTQCTRLCKLDLTTCLHRMYLPVESTVMVWWLGHKRSQGNCMVYKNQLILTKMCVLCPI